MAWIGLHKLSDVIFGITQTWSDNTSLVKGFFWTCFLTWRGAGL